MDALAIRSSSIEPDVGRLGTRFLVFPQPPFVAGYERPELVLISTPAGEIAAGPSDRRMYVVDPLLLKTPYAFPHLPPFRGDVFPPAEPGPDGNFDHIATGSRQFLAAHAFACVHRVLDICESYLGQGLPWFFEPTYDRLEIVPRLEWDNAQSGFGFLELGEDDARGDPFPFALNFDALAHETGHLVLLSALGVPAVPTEDYFAYHEAVADFIALVGLLHFDSALDKILRRTRGNLLIMNELDRFAELSDEKQVRMFSHSLKMSDVSAEVHDLSKPFAGALFDTLLEIFQVLLVERGLAALDPRQFRNIRRELTQAEIEAELSVLREDYAQNHFAVKSALEEARDLMGEILLRSWRRLSPENFSLGEAAEALIAAAEDGRAKRFADRIDDNFAWRGIL